MDRGVAAVLRQRLREALEIAVEVDVVLGHPADMGKAVRIDGVQEQHGGGSWPRGDDFLADEADLAPRAAEAFVPVRA